MPSKSTSEFRIKVLEMAHDYAGRCTPIELVGALEFVKEHVIHVAMEDYYAERAVEQGEDDD